MMSDTARGNGVPAPLDRLVGRRTELARLRELFGGARLVTVHGPGGAGKTRLAMEYAGAVGSNGAVRPCWVELAALTDPALLTQAVAATLDIGERPGSSLLDTLASALTGRRTLLVLDNCEHLIDACAELTGALLARCPDLSVLATSREALDVPGEVILRLGALSLPPRPPQPGSGAATPEELLRSDAVRLFVERAGAAAREFALTGANAAEVAGICQRLDGNPLAIELAARRIRILAPADILRRLDDRLRLLTAGSRGANDRHRDLNATIGWSYELLDDDEKALLRRVSVLPGGFGLDGAAAVAGELPGPLTGADVLDLVGSLEAKSLLVVGSAGGSGAEQAESARFRLLESIRLYAYERLIAAGEVAATRQRMVNWLVGKAEALAAQAFPTMAVLGPLDVERDNLQAVLSGDPLAIDPGDRLLLTAALAGCWRERGLFARGRSLLEAALTATAAGSAGTAHRGTALAQAAVLATDVGDADRAVALATEAVALASGAAALVCSVSRLGGALLATGDATAALRQSRRALEIALTTGPPPAAADPYAVAVCRHNVAYIGMHVGALDEAARLLAECLPYCRTRPEPWLRVGALHSAGTLALQQDDLDAAETYFREALESATNHLARKFHSIEGLAVVAAQRGDHRRALRLAAATAALRRGWGIQPHDPWDIRVGAAVATARAGLGEAESRRVQAAGAAMSASETEAYALSEPPVPGGPLTGRELEVARLLSSGLSTKELAGQLGIAERTVEAHLDNIRSKLDLRSRTQVATWWTRQRRAAD